MKKSLSFMLALIMVLCMIPGVAMAAEVIDTWDGTADTSWYNDTDTGFVLKTAEDLAGLAVLVDGGNSFAGKTIKLGTCLDLYFESPSDSDDEPESFDPIGDKSPFEGTFDGDGHIIDNLYQSGWAFGYEWGSYGSIGLFGELKDATVKNLIIEGAECFVEGGDVGGICGSATGTCVFENIQISNSVFATYNNGLGGIIGWSGAGNYTFKNIKMYASTVLAGLWGSFDSSIGGIVGQAEPGATYNFENVDIACRLDAYNDCTASYDYYNYRMCGMIMGRLEETTTIGGINYPDTSKYNITCINVSVYYDDWADYHYCEPTPGLNGGRGMRVESGYAYDGLPADYDHSQCVDNHMNLIPFDQIFGGDQLGVKALKENDGVNVVYANGDGTGIIPNDLKTAPSCVGNCKPAGEVKPEAPKKSGSGIKVEYDGGNSFSTSKSDVPTGVEIDNVPVSFTGNGSSFTVSGIPAGAKWITVRWNSTSVTTNFTPNGAYFAEVEIPKTGDVSFWAAIAEFLGF